MMQGELQAAREAAEKLVPQPRPDPEPWPPNARYTDSVQPKGPREIQVGSAFGFLILSTTLHTELVYLKCHGWKSTLPPIRMLCILVSG